MCEEGLERHIWSGDVMGNANKEDQRRIEQRHYNLDWDGAAMALGAAKDRYIWRDLVKVTAARLAPPDQKSCYAMLMLFRVDEIAPVSPSS